MTETRYTREHEWIRVEGDTATIGITAHAAEQLGDVVFVELPAVGAKFSQADDLAVVESVKAASEVFAPITCEIVAVNETLEADPGKVNVDPDGAGWFVKVKYTDAAQLAGLMDEDAYKAYVG